MAEELIGALCCDDRHRSLGHFFWCRSPFDEEEAPRPALICQAKALFSNRSDPVRERVRMAAVWRSISPSAMGSEVSLPRLMSSTAFEQPPLGQPSLFVL